MCTPSRATALLSLCTFCRSALEQILPTLSGSWPPAAPAPADETESCSKLRRLAAKQPSVYSQQCYTECEAMPLDQCDTVITWRQGDAPALCKLDRGECISDSVSVQDCNTSYFATLASGWTQHGDVSSGLFADWPVPVNATLYNSASLEAWVGTQGANHDYWSVTLSKWVSENIGHSLVLGDAIRSRFTTVNDASANDDTVYPFLQRGLGNRGFAAVAATLGKAAEHCIANLTESLWFEINLCMSGALHEQGVDVSGSLLNLELESQSHRLQILADPLHSLCLRSVRSTLWPTTWSSATLQETPLPTTRSSTCITHGLIWPEWAGKPRTQRSGHTCTATQPAGMMTWTRG